MSLSVMQKIMIGNLIGFILLISFASLTLLNGKKIEATTIDLSQKKLPGMIATSNLKSDLLTQTNLLYELYATNDFKQFKSNYEKSLKSISQDFNQLSNLTEFKTYERNLQQLNKEQIKSANQFVNVMNQSKVDWDEARSTLSAFSLTANQMTQELDTFVNLIASQTLSSALQSQNDTEELIKVGIALTGLMFVVVLGVAYYSYSQISKPLNKVSTQLTDVTNRRDLTYRLTHISKDEIGAIVTSTNRLLEEFQKMTHTLYGTSQEVNRTINNLTDISETTRNSIEQRSSKLRDTVLSFMTEIEQPSNPNDIYKNIEIDNHRAQLKFIQTHLKDIDEGTQATYKNTETLKNETEKLQKLADNMVEQIRLLNF